MATQCAFVVLFMLLLPIYFLEPHEPKGDHACDITSIPVYACIFHSTHQSCILWEVLNVVLVQNDADLCFHLLSLLDGVDNHVVTCMKRSQFKLVQYLGLQNIKAWSKLHLPYIYKIICYYNKKLLKRKTKTKTLYPFSSYSYSNNIKLLHLVSNWSNTLS